MLKRRIAETALNVILKHISEETIKDIKYDVTRGKNGIRKNYTDQLLKEKIIYNEPFRNVFFWRVEGDKEYKYRKWLRLWNRMLKVLYPPADSIEIFAKKIGGRLSEN